jgi:hypothetical protein
MYESFFSLLSCEGELVTLVHGDLHNNNMMFLDQGEGDLAFKLLDWQMVKAGVNNIALTLILTAAKKCVAVRLEVILQRRPKGNQRGLSVKPPPPPPPANSYWLPRSHVSGQSTQTHQHKQVDALTF